ncbi:MAG: dephospho-CoA kinase [Blastocatellia bacterium]|nr:dephospho-CoA kinase [Blastocatellia bacterium]
MLKVGLTGSISVGKSFVSSCLRDLGCHVFDADQIARTVVEPGTPALAEIVALFGTEVLTETGTLDRKKLGAIVFEQAGLRQKLNEIVHPRVHAEQNRICEEIAQTDPHAIVIMDAALMIESGSYKRFDKLIVVWCLKKLQIKRLMRRDHLTRAEALARLNAQMSSQEKRKYADFEINTSGPHTATRHQVEAVYEELKKLV